MTHPHGECEGPTCHQRSGVTVERVQDNLPEAREEGLGGGAALGTSFCSVVLATSILVQQCLRVVKPMALEGKLGWAPVPVGRPACS